MWMAALDRSSHRSHHDATRSTPLIAVRSRTDERGHRIVPRVSAKLLHRRIAERRPDDTHSKERVSRFSVRPAVFQAPMLNPHQQSARAFLSRTIRPGYRSQAVPEAIRWPWRHPIGVRIRTDRHTLKKNLFECLLQLKGGMSLDAHTVDEKAHATQKRFVSSDAQQHTSQ